MAQSASTFLNGCTRRDPKQRRGEKRVEDLLRAAVAEFSRAGYEGATMSAIADRAGAPIGSLYQFFPNKEAVARAVRTRHIQDVERQWLALDATSAAEFVDRFVDMMVEFVESHPAFLPLLDAPSSTQPVGPRHRLRIRLEEMFRALRPAMRPTVVERSAEIVLVMNKAMMGMYARATPESQRWITTEYRQLLGDFLARRTSAYPAASSGAVASRTRIRGKTRK